MKDRFGWTIGTNANRINKVLTAAWETVRTITDRAGLDRPEAYNVRNHLNKLCARGQAVRTRDGGRVYYRLSPHLAE
jgi:hypothetical protein